jgi:hypothetical protein
LNEKWRRNANRKTKNGVTWPLRMRTDDNKKATESERANLEKETAKLEKKQRITS